MKIVTAFLPHAILSRTCGRVFFIMWWENMNGVMASALTVYSYYLILTNHSLEKGPRH